MHTIAPKSDSRPATRFHGPRIHVPGIGRLFVRELTDDDDPSFQMLLTAPQTPASGEPILQTGRKGLVGDDCHHAIIGVFAPGPQGCDRLLGVAGVQVTGSLDEIGRFGILVDAPLRGLGLGQLLFAELLRLAESLKIRVVFARVDADNRPMLALAANLGLTVQRIPGDVPLLLSFGLASGTGPATTPFPDASSARVRREHPDAMALLDPSHSRH